MGLHRHGSIDPANMADVNKNFSKQANTERCCNACAAQRLRDHFFYFGMDNDTVGVSDRTVKEINSWPPGLRFLVTNAFSGDAAVRPPRESRTARSSKTLDGLCAVLDGAYAA